MKYFIDEKARKGSCSTCYFEFQKGYYRDGCWLADSICISDTLWDEFHLSELFRRVTEEFDYYGVTVITKKQWEEIIEISRDADSIWHEVVADAAFWVAKCFEEYEVFSILGM